MGDGFSDSDEHRDEVLKSIKGPDDTLSAMRQFIDECANPDCPDVEIRRTDWNNKKGVCYVLVSARLADKKRSGPFRIKLCHGCYDSIKSGKPRQ